MSKNIFHDIVPPEKRSIRNIKIQSIRKGKSVADDIRRDDDLRFEDSPQKAPKKAVWFLATCCFIGLVFSVLYLISKADINITIKKIDLQLADNISATKDGTALTYSSISLTDTDSTLISGSGQKEVSTKASGQVMMYNTQAVSQILVAKTRLETSDGLVFFLDKRVVVPAQKTIAGKKTPGSVEVSITAEKPGPKYNVGLADFTVVAFKGDPRFNAVYGRGKTSVAGGNLGMVPIVTDREVSEAKKTVEKKLTDKVLSSARSQIPADSILLDNVYSIKFEDLPQEVKDGKVSIGKNATFSGYIFKKENLVDFIKNLRKVSIPIEDTLTIDSSELKISSLKEENDILKFNASGPIEISYVLDLDMIKSQIKGKSKSDVVDLLTDYASIESALIRTYPLWLIPRNTDRIKININ